MSNPITDNVFARLLLFYDRYRRSKLNSNDLQVCFSLIYRVLNDYLIINYSALLISMGRKGFIYYLLSVLLSFI